MQAKYVLIVWAIGILVDSIFAIIAKPTSPHNNGLGTQFLYTRCDLLSLRYAPARGPGPEALPACIWNRQSPTSKQDNRKKKRGSRGGIRNRLRRRGSRLPLPAITLSNVRSLHNKMNELSALTK